MFARVQQIGDLGKAGAELVGDVAPGSTAALFRAG